MGPVVAHRTLLPSLMTTSNNTRSDRHNTGDRVPTQEELINNLLDIGAFELTPTEVFTLLSAQRRRETIRVLARQSQEISEETYIDASAISEMVCASDPESSGASNMASEEKHATDLTLIQTHLPLLDDLGVVEYHDQMEKVRPTDEIIKLDALLSLIDAVSGGNDTDAE